MPLALLQRILESSDIFSQNPTNAVGGSFILSLQTKPLDSSLNPTHGSGWIVQVQPTSEGRSTASLNPTHCRGGLFKSSLHGRTRDSRFASPSLPSPREGRER